MNLKGFSLLADSPPHSGQLLLLLINLLLVVLVQPTDLALPLDLTLVVLILDSYVLLIVVYHRVFAVQVLRVASHALQLLVVVLVTSLELIPLQEPLVVQVALVMVEDGLLPIVHHLLESEEGQLVLVLDQSVQRLHGVVRHE